MLAQSIAIWALMTMILVSWVENYFYNEQKKHQLVEELVANMNAYVDAHLDAMGNTGKVVLLTDDTFHKHVSSGKHFVKLYSPWCPYCNRMDRSWDDLAKELEQEPGVTISKIDCTTYRGPCLTFEVGEYPMLLWIEDGRKIEMYEGIRSLVQMLDFTTQTQT